MKLFTSICDALRRVFEPVSASNEVAARSRKPKTVPFAEAEAGPASAPVETATVAASVEKTLTDCGTDGVRLTRANLFLAQSRLHLRLRDHGDEIDVKDLLSCIQRLSELGAEANAGSVSDGIPPETLAGINGQLGLL